MLTTTKTLTVTAALTALAACGQGAFSLNSQSTCQYEGINAKCGELVVEFKSPSSRFEEWLSLFKTDVSVDEGRIIDSKPDYNRIVVRFPDDADIPGLKSKYGGADYTAFVGYNVAVGLD